jgi:hypothetical protein
MYHGGRLFKERRKPEPIMKVINDNGEPFMRTLKLVANGTIGGR